MKQITGKYMTTLIAKPIVKDQYWVITDAGGNKVGNVSADNGGYELKLNGINTHYASTNAIKRKVNIKFQPLKTNKTAVQLPHATYPTTKLVFNSIVDVRRKLHIFTKSAKSKCYYAAGWFALDLGSQHKIVFCPKYIFIERYAYSGPFKTQVEAENMINTA